jgi:hypothetical protein
VELTDARPRRARIHPRPNCDLSNPAPLHRYTGGLVARYSIRVVWQMAEPPAEGDKSSSFRVNKYRPKAGHELGDSTCASCIVHIAPGSLRKRLVNMEQLGLLRAFHWQGERHTAYILLWICWTRQGRDKGPTTRNAASRRSLCRRSSTTLKSRCHDLMPRVQLCRRRTPWRAWKAAKAYRRQTACLVQIGVGCACSRTDGRRLDGHGEVATAWQPEA